MARPAGQRKCCGRVAATSRIHINAGKMSRDIPVTCKNPATLAMWQDSGHAFGVFPGNAMSRNARPPRKCCGGVALARCTVAGNAAKLPRGCRATSPRNGENPATLRPMARNAGRCRATSSTSDVDSRGRGNLQRGFERAQHLCSMRHFAACLSHGGTPLTHRPRCLPLERADCLSSARMA